ncbi:uncharacterized protein LOC107458088 isoform X1 [Arachis duranensis]|uniref:Uncharacterized protein LOC107458088 isoform X1 n=1 Tax=Arachis duranensis TaxID=130453 RepID=A0A6P4AW34_ARADU|nr:uncharacterized protein LOC107458088 isoform X1 [Arachis duranensis]
MSKFQQGRSLMKFTSYFGSVFSHDHDIVASPSKEIMCLASVFAGIILCILVYRSSAVLSSLLFNKAYGKLSTIQKIEWNNRGISTFHALFVSFASFYFLIISDIFKDGSHEDLIINRSSSLTNTALGISVGYFVTDLVMILWHFPALGGLEYVLHHGISMLSILISLLSGQVQVYILMVLFSESTTPSINLRWYLDVGGFKSSKLYIVNGIALFLGWLVARIFLFMFFFYHMWIHFDEVKEVNALCYYFMFVVPSVLTMMNIFWFWKIAKGMVKTITKAKHTKRA